MAGGVADPGPPPGVQRRAVASLPGLELVCGGLELLDPQLRGWAQLDLGAALLPLQVGADPSAQQAQGLAADARRLGPGVRAATEALAAAGRSSRAFHRRRVRYNSPVWVVWGDCDALVPRSHIRGVTGALPQARVHLWPGMGHHPQRERPGELAALIEAACEHGTSDLTRTRRSQSGRPPRVARPLRRARQDRAPTPLKQRLDEDHLVRSTRSPDTIKLARVSEAV